jgi:hypothetical protein
MSHSLSTLRVGCIDPLASNYDPGANVDVEPTTCVYKEVIVWNDCDHNPDEDLIDWSVTNCVNTLSGSRCDVRLLLLFFTYIRVLSETSP